MKRYFILSLILISLFFANCIAQTSKKQKAPNFALKTYEGKIIELAKLKGKVVVLNFWATWCPPCRAEIPDFIKVYNVYKNKGLEIIGIALDGEGWPSVKPFMDSKKINYPIALGTMDIVNQYGGIEAIPTTFFVDKDGNIADIKLGYLSKEILEQKLKLLLK